MHLAVREAARVTRMSVATFRMYQTVRLLAVRHGVTHNFAWGTGFAGTARTLTVSVEWRGYRWRWCANWGWRAV